MNLSGRPERVLDPRQTATLERWMDNGAGGDMVAAVRENTAEVRALRLEGVGQTFNVFNLLAEPASQPAQREAQRRAMLPPA